MSVGVNRMKCGCRMLSPLLTFRLKILTDSVTAHHALYQLRHEVKTVRTAAWDGRTVASCTDKWQPEPHLAHSRRFPFSYTHFTSLESNRGLSMILRLHTHTHTHTHTNSVIPRRCDAQIRASSVENQYHAITHSRMRDNQYRTPPHRARHQRNALSCLHLLTNDRHSVGLKWGLHKLKDFRS